MIPIRWVKGRVVDSKPRASGDDPFAAFGGAALTA